MIYTTSIKLKPKNVDEYLKKVNIEAKTTFKKIRQTIKSIVPEAEETISYQMPAFKLNGIVIWFAASRDHCSVYVYPRVLKNFKEEIKPYRTSKSTLKFPIDKPLPVQLIKKIIKFSAKENLKKDSI